MWGKQKLNLIDEISLSSQFIKLQSKCVHPFKRYCCWWSRCWWSLPAGQFMVGFGTSTSWTCAASNRCNRCSVRSVVCTRSATAKYITGHTAVHSVWTKRWCSITCSTLMAWYRVPFTIEVVICIFSRYANWPIFITTNRQTLTHVSFVLRTTWFWYVTIRIATKCTTHRRSSVISSSRSRTFRTVISWTRCTWSPSIKSCTHSISICTRRESTFDGAIIAIEPIYRPKSLAWDCNTSFLSTIMSSSSWRTCRNIWRFHMWCPAPNEP